MVKHARKRQKTGKEATARPLGYDSLIDDASKDDEERRLESTILFGTKCVQRDTNTQVAAEDDLDEQLGNEMQNLLDQDLFFLDDGLDSSNPARGDGFGATESIHIGGDSDDESQSDGDSQPSFLNPTLTWSHPADHQNEPTVSISSGHLQRKLQDAPAETIQNLLSSTSGIEHLRDINQSTQGSGEVKVVTFHPSEKVPVVCVDTTDRRYGLFNVDGHTSPLLHTLHIPSLPITSSNSAQFHPQGSSLLLTGPRLFFYVHDFQSGLTVRHSRGLWETTFSATNDAVRVDRRGRRGRGNSDSGAAAAGGGEGLEVSAFSADIGDLLAVAGRGGYIHLVDWNSGAGQVVGGLKCGENDGADAALGGGAGNGGKYLAAMNGDAEMYIWDVGERKCIRRWKDDGGFRGAGRVMTGSRGGHDGKGDWLAVGSTTGFVNVSNSFRSPPSFNNDLRNPKPIKSIANLTAAVSTSMFNHDAQILAVASREKRDALRLIHLPSLTSFSN
ncbi:hypothetical protein BD779DRAFT_1556724 [Infundibulicybe gibba]|nr:hypothetical protein BD779DRAFT_1556724 [Infundibulicybe gibba]